jgi:hypothetical protein
LALAHNRWLMTCERLGVLGQNWHSNMNKRVQAPCSCKLACLDLKGCTQFCMLGQMQHGAAAYQQYACV